MNALDLVVIGIILFSGLFAFTRGFVREALSVATWVGAGLAALYFYPYLRPVADRFLSNPTVANIATGVAIFLVALILLSILSSAIAGRVKNSSLSALDRTLGLLFGLARGALLACLGYLALAWALPADQRPAWMTQARSLPFLQSGAETIQSFLPESLVRRTVDRSEETRKALEQAQQLRSLVAPPAPAAAPPKQGQQPVYNEGERRDMNRLMQQNSR